MSVLRLRCSFSHLRSRRVVKHWLDKLLGWVVAINPLSFKLALSGVPVPLLGSLWYPSKNMLTYGGGGGGYWVLKVYLLWVGFETLRLMWGMGFQLQGLRVRGLSGFVLSGLRLRVTGFPSCNRLQPRIKGSKLSSLWVLSGLAVLTALTCS